MSSFGQKGIEAVNNKQYKDAVELLDKAIDTSRSPSWLLARATAHQHLENFDLALRDAELAYHAAADRGSGNSRQLMIDAQYRRSVVLFKLHRHADADCAARWSQRLIDGRPANEDDGVGTEADEQGLYAVTIEDLAAEARRRSRGKQGRQDRGQVFAQALGSGGTSEADKNWNRAHMWRSQVLSQMKDLPSTDPGRRVTIVKIPPRPQPKAAEAVVKDGAKSSRVAIEPPAKVQKPAVTPGSVPDEKMKLRSDFYQSGQVVTISLFAKNVNKETLDVKFSEQLVRLDIPCYASILRFFANESPGNPRTDSPRRSALRPTRRSRVLFHALP